MHLTLNEHDDDDDDDERLRGNFYKLYPFLFLFQCPAVTF